MHSALVLWMVQLLLTSTHTRGVQPGSKGGEGAQETSDNEGGEAAGEDGVSEEENWDQGMGLTAVLAVDLKKEYETLSDSLKRLTVSLTRYVIYDKKKRKNISLWTGFEPAQGAPNGFQVHRLNHSATTATGGVCCHFISTLSSPLGV